MRFIFGFFIGLFRSLTELVELAVRSVFVGEPSDADDGEGQTRSWWLRIVGAIFWLPRKIFSALFEVISYPLSLSNVSDERRRYLLGGIPAVVFILVTAGVIAAGATDGDSIYRKYRTKMEAAMVEGDFVLASVLGSRIMEDADQNNPDIKFAFARALVGTKDLARANLVLSELAPDDTAGYSPAHALRALTLANTLQGDADANIFSRLKWHLDNSRGERNEELYRLRFTYYQKVGQAQLAIEQLELANNLNPRNAIPLSDLYQQQGATESRKRVLQESVVRIGRILNEQPFDKELRTTLALVYVRMKDFGKAEQVLMKGLELMPSPEMVRIVADFYVMRHDEVYADSRNDMTTRLGFLEKAIQVDRNHEGIYLRLSQLYTDSLKEAESSKVRALLESMIADGKSPSLAHFALGTVAIMDDNQEKAVWHLNQAYKLDEKIPMVCNNLAWMIAHMENPDLERALELSKIAVDSTPGEPEFKDTLGTILAKLGRLPDAVVVYEKLLSEMPDKKRVHAKLAEIYKELGQTSLFQLHLERSKP